MRILIDEQAAQSLESRLSKFDGAGGYQGARLSPLPTSRWEKSAVELVRTHRQAWESGSISRGGLVLVGPVGIGKTRAAIAVCRAVGEFDPAGISMLTESELLAPEVPPWELQSHIRRLIVGRRCIVVDDIGAVARPADQVMSAWKFLLDLIRAADHPTIFIGTTNRQTWSDRGGLADWMGAQAVSRLREHSVMGSTGWTDHRTGTDHEQWKSQLAPARPGR